MILGPKCRLTCDNPGCDDSAETVQVMMPDGQWVVRPVDGWQLAAQRQLGPALAFCEKHHVTPTGPRLVEVP